MRRGRARAGRGSARAAAPARPRLDPAALLALVSLAAFLGVTLLAPLHVHDHAHDRSHVRPDGETAPRADRAPCGHAAHDAAPSGGSSHPDAPPDPHDDGHDCPICQLAGESRAPLPAEPVPPPRVAEIRTVASDDHATAPSLPRYRASRPRAPPHLAR
jgi:hypothetical protein